MMTAPKTGIDVTIAAVYMQCPNCGGNVAAAESGSFMICHNGVTYEDAKCETCSLPVRVPTWVEKKS